MRTLLLALVISTALSVLSTCGPAPSPLRDAQRACTNSQVPSEQQIKLMDAKTLFMLSENARVASDLVAMQRALGQPFDPCNYELALNESRFKQLALATADIERTQAQIDALKQKSKR